MASEPLTGKRLVKITERKTKTDWAYFLENIETLYSDSEKITLVMDNLNTHTPGSFYEAFQPVQAKQLWDRFDFVFTPKHGSWLNMAEIELNVLTGQCLNRRIDSIEDVRRETSAWQKYRDKGFSVIAVEVARDRERATKFIDENKLTYHLLEDNENTAVVREQFDVGVFPTSFMIDKEGRIMYCHIGFDKGDEEKLEKEILELGGF